MKFLIVILAVVALAHAEDEWKVKSSADAQAIRVACAKENALSEENIQKLKNFEYPNEEPIRKYLLCIVKALGIFCEDEGYHPERIAQQFKSDLDEAEVLSTLQGCSDKNEQGSPVDVWAYRGHECFIQSKYGKSSLAYLKKEAEQQS